MKYLYVLLFFLVSQISFARCFDLSEDGQTWDLNPFTLCVEKNNTTASEFKIILSKNKNPVAIYFLNSLSGGGDTWVFGIDPVSGSFLDESIFIAIGDGEVIIGKTTYYYR